MITNFGNSKLRNIADFQYQILTEPMAIWLVNGGDVTPNPFYRTRREQIAANYGYEKEIYVKLLNQYYLEKDQPEELKALII